MLRYMLRTAAEVDEHSRQLHRKQGTNERIHDWWVSITTAQAYLLFPRRRVDDVVLCDVVESGALFIHGTWTALINPMPATKTEIEDLFFTRGVHLEVKQSAAQFETKTGPVTFLADADDSISIREHLIALTAELRSLKNSGPRRQRDRNGLETRKCCECGQVGHIRPDCPDLQRNKKKGSPSEDYAGSLVAFVAAHHHDAAAPSSPPNARSNT